VAKVDIVNNEVNQETWPEPPEHLSEKAKTLFGFYVGKTVRAPGQITLFIKGLESMDQADECGRIIREEGLSVKSERSGLQRQHPLLNTQRETTAQMLKVWKELRLNINRQHFAGIMGFEDLA